VNLINRLVAVPGVDAAPTTAKAGGVPASHPTKNLRPFQEMRLDFLRLEFWHFFFVREWKIMDMYEEMGRLSDSEIEFDENFVF
jgi:hypothetical protein